MRVRIELTNEIEKAITMCCPLKDNDTSEKCFERCALAGICMEYYTGDSSKNQDEPKNNLKKFSKTLDKQSRI